MSKVKSLALLDKCFYVRRLSFQWHFGHWVTLGRFLVTTQNAWTWTRFSNCRLTYMSYTKMCTVRSSQHQAKNHHSSDEVKIWVVNVKDTRQENQAAVEHVRPLTAILSQTKCLSHSSSCLWQSPAAHLYEGRIEHAVTPPVNTYTLCYLRSEIES